VSIGRIGSVATRGKAVIVVDWDDGHRAAIDLAPIIAERPILSALGDPEIFHSVRLPEAGWSIEWPKAGIDLGAAQLRRWADEQAGDAMPASAFRAWMDRHGMTQDRAAEALGLSRRTIAYYLSGEQVIPKTVLLATEGFDARQAA
jgi:hypothetical protein